MPEFIFVLAVIALAIAVPYMLRRSRRSTRPESIPVRTQWSERKIAQKARHSSDRILVDLAETSREISGRMDTKIRILNTLIRDAERCINRLEELQGIKPASTEISKTPSGRKSNNKKNPEEPPAMQPPSPAMAPTDDNLWPGHSAWTNSPPWPGHSMQPTVMSEIPQPPITPPSENTGKNTGKATDIPGEDEIIPAAGKQNSDASPVASPTAAAETKAAKIHSDDALKNNISAKVVGLLDEGFSVPEIARRLEISRREVKLIQQLQKNPGNTG